MRGGELFRQLRDLVDVAEDHGQLFWSLNVTAVLNGSTKSLSAMGEEALRRLLEARLRPNGPSSWAEALAYEATRADPLAVLFEALQLDSRLRHHRRALLAPEKAEVVRSVAGELQRAVKEANSPPWCTALLKEMASCLLDLHQESLRGSMSCTFCGNALSPEESFCRRCGRRNEAGARGPPGRRPVPLQTDVKLGALLRSGSSKEILERLVWLHEQEPSLGDQITLALAAALPRLNIMRLLVFGRVLHELFKPEDGSPSARHITQELHPQRRAALTSAVTRAVLASDLNSLPYELEEQVEDLRLSPYLSDPERHALLELMVAPCEARDLRDPDRWRDRELERDKSGSDPDEKAYPFDARQTEEEENANATVSAPPEDTTETPSRRNLVTKSQSFLRARLSMPDRIEISRMREEYLQRKPGYCFSARHQPLRVEIYLLLEEPTSSRSAKMLSIVVFVCIILSIALFMLETMPELKDVPDEFWVASECFFTIVFMVEYMTRLLVCDVSGVSAWAFIRTPMNIVDVVAVLPFFVILALSNVGKAIGFIRAVRLVRLFRIFKLGRYSTGLKMMMVALGNSGQALSVLVFFLGIGCVLFSSMVYHLEKLSCPDQTNFNTTELSTYKEECTDKLRRVSQYGLCCNEQNVPLEFPSILSTFWWTIVTMSTVGYGDIAPRTPPGKLAGAVTMCSGILLFALPIALIGSRFQEAYNMAVSRDSPSLQVRKRSKDRDEPPFKIMSTRLRLLRFSNTSMTRLAKELSKELEEASEMQEDIRMFERAEKELQKEVLKSGLQVVSRLQFHVDAAKVGATTTASSAPSGGLAEGRSNAAPASPPLPEVVLPHQPMVEPDREVVVPDRSRLGKMVSFDVPRQGG
ncbi:Potassium voltage-gated channel subfamily B member 2 (Voltage-gated potassium channel subunit Kv2.2) [Durusdinium trenchii]|uniref:Potassium voltage-gated channel subfamily B member 2 (Voltage-gated potassium channel subunit Kv2.2) n=1 Tax=Durusdinium trenchii TaxID=1381693 RepID=A0ABP0QP88_9DINO